MNIAVLGGGSWGSALAIHLARKKHSVMMWEFFEKDAKEMQETRECSKLPGVKFPETLTVSSQMDVVLQEAEVILMVVPSDKVESTIKMAAEFLKEQPVILCSKGFASDARLLSDIIKEHAKGNVFCLYGPTHAEEVCHGKLSGMVLAGKDGDKIKEILEDKNLRIELSDDLIGVQVAAGLKNVVAVFAGIIEGMELGDNTRAYVMTHCLAEMHKIGVAMGAQEKTFYGIAGMGDLIVTCTSKHSRNFHVGKEIGKGRALQDILAEMSMIAEGVTAAKYVKILKEKLQLEMPFLAGVYEMLFEGKKPHDVLGI